ncbi:MAG: sensor histidine kinase [Candidatus Thorarchaeota archaeon]
MRRRFGYDYLILLAVFFAVVVFVSVSLLTGTAWSMTTETQMATWIMVISTTGAATGAMVTTYSFIAYMEKPELRFMVLALVGIDMVFVLFAFMFSHRSLMEWIPFFPGHQRNRTIVAAFGLTLVPSALSASFRGEAQLVGLKRWMVVLLGGVAIPLCITWFMVSPNPVFITVDPYGGLFNATPIGLALLLVSFVSLVISFVRYFADWLQSGNRISFAFSLALILWTLALVLLAVLESALQIIEAIWYSLIPIGLALIALAMLMSTVLDPHRALRDLVDHRTRELLRSEMESAFYLNMWSHKIGNLLQGLITYVELSEDFGDGKSDESMLEVAHQLGREATIVNRQVINLSRIKASQDTELESRNLMDAVTTAIDDASNLLGDNRIEVDVNITDDAWVMADDLLDLLFASLFVFAGKHGNAKRIRITSSVSDDEVGVNITCESECFSQKRIRQAFGDDFSLDSLTGLELYTVRLLLSRYNCHMEYPIKSGAVGNAVKIRFLRGQQQPDDSEAEEQS